VAAVRSTSGVASASKWLSSTQVLDMLVEKRKQTTKMISFRADDEMFYALKALSQMLQLLTLAAFT
jgi:hypothetical protein